MLRKEHNKHFNATRQPSEQVSCNVSGYGELDQYDADCAPCWLGHAHTWKDHDKYVTKKRETDAAWSPDQARLNGKYVIA